MNQVDIERLIDKVSNAAVVDLAAYRDAKQTQAGTTYFKPEDSPFWLFLVLAVLILFALRAARSV